jgi:hypothetical protein
MTLTPDDFQHASRCAMRNTTAIAWRIAVDTVAIKSGSAIKSASSLTFATLAALQIRENGEGNEHRVSTFTQTTRVNTMI